MLAFFSFLTLSYMGVVIREEVVVTFFIRRNQHEGISLQLHYKLLSLRTGAEFLFFLFNLWRLWVLLVQTGIRLMVTKLLVSENLLLCTDMLLRDLCRDREQNNSQTLFGPGINICLK